MAVFCIFHIHLYHDHLCLPGECVLEWNGGSSGKEACPVPLLKDRFGSERRKAKVLNFSIAYGKTAHGLGKDWGVSMDEAQETVNRWYSDRPEVRSCTCIDCCRDSGP